MCCYCEKNEIGTIATAKVREYGTGEPRDKFIRLYNQIAFNYSGTRYVYDVCSKCADKLANGEISISTDLSVNRSFTNG